MVKIRLARHGKKKNPVYRIVAIDHQNKNAGKALEVLGFWHPQADNKEIDKKALDKWVKNGAQVSDAVKKLLK